MEIFLANPKNCRIVTCFCRIWVKYRNVEIILLFVPSGMVWSSANSHLAFSMRHWMTCVFWKGIKLKRALIHIPIEYPKWWDNYQFYLCVAEILVEILRGNSWISDCYSWWTIIIFFEIPRLLKHIKSGFTNYQPRGVIQSNFF